MKIAFTFSFLLSALVLTAVAAPPAKPTSTEPDAGYRAGFEKWKAELVDDLKKNWVPLAGLFWLQPGDNSFGSDPSNKIVFPAGTTPAHAGVFTLQGENVTMKLEPGVKATIDDKPVTTAVLESDVSGKATTVAMGNLRMKVIKRGERLGIRLKDLDSPAVRNFHPLVFYPLSTKYIVNAKWVPSDGSRTVDVPNVLGDVTTEKVAGEARFTIDGQELHLTALGGDAQKGLFFVFNDLTSKSATYPAGRFLETGAVSNGSVVLDFNKAYNPPCASTPYATCPLAPRENRLQVAIPAGEKYDRTHAVHH
jgi:uncharacterized protein (DUF1684 family)